MDAPAPAPAPEPPQTLGESLAHVPRAKRWTTAVFWQIVALVVIPVLQVYSFGGRSFFTDVAWRLVLELSLTAYLSLILATHSYAELFLPRTPVHVADGILEVGFQAIGFCVYMVNVVVLVVWAADARVLAGCTGLDAAFVVGVVVLWVWLARTYGGDDAEDPPPAAAEDMC